MSRSKDWPDHQDKAYVVTLELCPRKGIEESKILDDIGAILDASDYWTYGLVSLTERIMPTSDKQCDLNEARKNTWKKHITNLLDCM